MKRYKKLSKYAWGGGTGKAINEVAGYVPIWGQVFQANTAIGDAIRGDGTDVNRNAAAGFLDPAGNQLEALERGDIAGALIPGLGAINSAEAAEKRKQDAYQNKTYSTRLQSQDKLKRYNSYGLPQGKYGMRYMAGGGEVDPKKVPVLQKDELLVPSTYKKAGISDSTVLYNAGYRVHQLAGNQGRIKRGNYVGDYTPAVVPNSTSPLKMLSEEDIQLLQSNPHSKEIIPNNDFKSAPGYLGSRINEYDENGVKKYDADEYVLRKQPNTPKKAGVTFTDIMGNSTSHETMGRFVSSRKAFGGYYGNGGKLPYPTDGSGMDNLASNVAQYSGGTHEQGGIDLDTNQDGQPNIEVEDQEVIKDDMVLSDRLVPSEEAFNYLKSLKVKKDTNDTYASVAEKLGRKKGNWEKKLDSTNVGQKEAARRMIGKYDSAIDNLFEDQEMQKEITNTDMKKFGGYYKGGGKYIGDIATTVGGIANQALINQLETNIEPTYSPDPANIYTDRTNYIKDTINSRFTTAARGLNQSSAQSNLALKSNLYADSLNSMNSALDQETQRKDALGQQFQQLLQNNRQFNTQNTNYFRKESLDNRNQKVALTQQNLDNTVRGFMGNKTQRDLMELDFAKTVLNTDTGETGVDDRFFGKYEDSENAYLKGLSKVGNYSKKRPKTNSPRYIDHKSALENFRK